MSTMTAPSRPRTPSSPPTSISPSNQSGAPSLARVGSSWYVSIASSSILLSRHTAQDTCTFSSSRPIHVLAKLICLLSALRASNSKPKLCRDVLPPPLIPRPRKMGDPNHPARARAALSCTTTEPTPSVASARGEFQNLMGALCVDMKARSNRVAAKSFKASVRDKDKSRCVDGRITKPSRDKTTIRRERTSEAVCLPPQPTKTARLKAYATHPDLSSSAAVPMDQDDPPVAGPSTQLARVFLKSSMSEPDYDFPSSTPTPPPKERTRPKASSSSDKRTSSSVSRTFQSTSSSPLGMTSHPSRSSHGDSFDACRLSRPATSPDDSIESSSLMMQDTSSPDSPEPSSIRPEPKPVPYVPRSLSAMSMGLSAPPPDPDAPLPTFTTAAPSSTPLPFLPPPSRPFVAPSQVPGASQIERPRASQHPPPLGMLRRHGLSSKFQTKSKPFKVPFAVKKDAAPAPDAGPSKSESPAGMGGFHRGGSAMTGVSVEREECGRSLSPVVPDPPHVVARAQALQAERWRSAAEPQPEAALEMTARRPEPVPMKEDEEENRDANSSADLWANVDDITEDIM
ncbi:hypothetical protein C8Q80DRAFT_770755 [Daedaleopsis nitida]|nr:hypothetical protein C8Q80DRAFT_770755 [Daedaleopsis nitida]